jgi:hypothetical protein
MSPFAKPLVTPPDERNSRLQILGFLTNQAFEPEVISNMSRAFEGACEALQLKIVDDPATRHVAAKIIELVQRGIRDQPTLLQQTLKEFGAEP